MKFEQADLDQAYEQLQSRESYTRVVIGSMVGIAVGTAAFFLMAVLTGHVIIYFFPVTVGIGVKYIGDVFSAKYRALAGVFGVVSYLLSTLFLEKMLWFVALAPVAFAITYYLAKTRMSEIERTAVWKKGLE